MITMYGYSHLFFGIHPFLSYLCIAFSKGVPNITG
jgi:hypothetical protein